MPKTQDAINQLEQVQVTARAAADSIEALRTLAEYQGSYEDATHGKLFEDLREYVSKELLYASQMLDDILLE